MTENVGWGGGGCFFLTRHTRKSVSQGLHDETCAVMYRFIYKLLAVIDHSYSPFLFLFFIRKNQESQAGREFFHRIQENNFGTK